MDEQQIYELNHKLDEISNLLHKSETTLEDIPGLTLSLEHLSNEFSEVKKKLEAMFNPETGIYPRISALESWKIQADKREEERKKVMVATITAFIAAVFTSVWNLIVKR